MKLNLILLIFLMQLSLELVSSLNTNNRYLSKFKPNTDLINLIKNRLKRKTKFDWLPDYDEETSTKSLMENATATTTAATTTTGSAVQQESATVTSATTVATTSEKPLESDIKAILWSSDHDLTKPIKSKVVHDGNRKKPTTTELTTAITIEDDKINKNDKLIIEENTSGLKARERDDKEKYTSTTTTEKINYNEDDRSVTTATLPTSTTMETIIIKQSEISTRNVKEHSDNHDEKETVTSTESKNPETSEDESVPTTYRNVEMYKEMAEKMLEKISAEKPAKNGTEEVTTTTTTSKSSEDIKVEPVAEIEKIVITGREEIKPDESNPMSMMFFTSKMDINEDMMKILYLQSIKKSRTKDLN